MKKIENLSRTIIMKKIKISQKALEELSLDALYQYCPLCGQIGKNSYCKECDFKWKKGYLYYYNSHNIHTKVGCLKKMKKDSYKKYRAKKKRLRSQADNLWFEICLKDKCEVCDNLANQVHHFFPKGLYPAVRFQVSNGVSLCMSCHFLHHHRAKPEIHATIIENRGQKWYKDLLKKSKEEVKQNLQYYLKVIKKLNE